MGSCPRHFGPSIRESLDAHPLLEIMYFPVAAPDLNPHEHVWKATRRAVSHNHLPDTLPELADRFEQHLLSNTFYPAVLDDPIYQMVCAMSSDSSIRTAHPIDSEGPSIVLGIPRQDKTIVAGG